MAERERSSIIYCCSWPRSRRFEKGKCVHDWRQSLYFHQAYAISLRSDPCYSAEQTFISVFQFYLYYQNGDRNRMIGWFEPSLAHKENQFSHLTANMLSKLIHHMSTVSTTQFLLFGNKQISLLWNTEYIYVSR